MSSGHFSGKSFSTFKLILVSQAGNCERVSTIQHWYTQDLIVFKLQGCYEPYLAKF